MKFLDQFQMNVKRIPWRRQQANGLPAAADEFLVDWREKWSIQAAQ
jgi:hypothetical protein